MRPVQGAFEPAVATQFRSGADRRRADARALSRARRERRRGDRRRATALAGLLASAAALAAHGRLHHHLPEVTLFGFELGRPWAAQEPAATPSPEASPYERFIEEAAELYGVSANLVRAVIQTESNFNPQAESRAGARGLMQLTPVTLRELKLTIDPFDPRENILAGTKYLGLLLARHSGNVPLALASYNAGPTAVRRHRGIPPYKETRGYVKKVQAELAELRAADESTLAD